jgi:membrane peptidoglycan carboxypeptidase
LSADASAIGVAPQYAGGASTLTMQLAKMLFLSLERTFERKFLQIVITFQLEHRFSKQKIFELYANQVPLGQRGNFSPPVQTLHSKCDTRPQTAIVVG